MQTVRKRNTSHTTKSPDLLGIMLELGIQLIDSIRLQTQIVLSIKLPFKILRFFLSQFQSFENQPPMLIEYLLDLTRL
ncbi:hypothetical protein BGZ59_000945 [Podila verticillata]|nr:hypothetical protein BGZ59_000945 [Podila verticillata]